MREYPSAFGKRYFFAGGLAGTTKLKHFLRGAQVSAPLTVLLSPPHIGPCVLPQPQPWMWLCTLVTAQKTEKQLRASLQRMPTSKNTSAKAVSAQVCSSNDALTAQENALSKRKKKPTSSIACLTFQKGAETPPRVGSQTMKGKSKAQEFIFRMERQQNSLQGGVPRGCTCVAAL